MARTTSFPMWQVRVRTMSHHLTWFLGRRFPATFPFVFVLGYPKSGTTWACQLLADVLQLPFPRYSLLPIGCPAVVHGHEGVDARYPKGVYVVRDGRDVMVSRYFFSLRHIADGPNPDLSPALRAIYGPMRSKADVQENLARLIEFTARSPKISGNWAAHVRTFFNTPDHHFTLLRYEDLLDDGAGAISRAAEFLSGEAPDPELVQAAVRKFDFSRQRGRASSSDGARKFLRKGQAGDWRNHFTPDIARLFDRHFGDMLIAAGYEPDRSWVERASAPAPQAATA